MKKTKRILGVLLAIVLLAIILPLPCFSPKDAKASISSEALEFNGHSYKLFDDGMNWYAAKEACEELGGHLITINTKDENDFITGILTNSATKWRYWTAIMYDYDLKFWVHYDGSVVDYQNWAEYEPRDLQYQNEAFVYLSGMHYTTGAGTNNFEKEIGEWSYASSEGATHDSINHPLGGFGYICEWDDVIDNEEYSAIFPECYNFNSDRWSFSNINEKIALDYYIGLFGEAKGTELYNFRGEKSKHGHCFGMAVSTAATLINAPYVTDYISWTGIPYTELSSVNKGTMNLDMDISAKDYIKYCHIYQDSAYVCRQRNNSSYSGIENVYNAVKAAVQNSENSTMVVIDLWGGSGGHTVYAVGVSGNDILVNDSNVPGSIQRIKINGDNWTYSAAGLHWDSSVDATIDYVENCIEPYIRLVCNIDVEGGNVPKTNSNSISYTEESELNGTNNISSDYIEPIDLDKLLVVTENNDFSFASKENMYEVMSTAGEGEDDTETNIYWLDYGNSVNAENIGKESSELKLVGEDSKITAEIPQDAVVEMKIDNDKINEIYVETEKKENITVTFTSYEGDISNTIITGSSNETEVFAKETEEGIVLSGLNDINIKYENDDEVIETKVNVKDGTVVNIIIDDENNTIETEWECHHSDNNNNNVCDNCNEVIKNLSVDEKCSHICHSSNEFIKLIWTILNFFSMIFGANAVCECGAAHY